VGGYKDDGLPQQSFEAKQYLVKAKHTHTHTLCAEHLGVGDGGRGADTTAATNTTAAAAPAAANTPTAAHLAATTSAAAAGGVVSSTRGSRVL